MSKHLSAVSFCHYCVSDNRSAWVLDRRTLFLNHQTQAGFYLRDSKWQAVKDGDFSGTVVHRSVVHLAQLVGSMLWKRHHKTDVFLISEDAELRSILNALEDPPDSATLVMIYTLLAWCFLFQRQLEVGREYLMKASQVVTIQNLQLTPPCMDAMLVLGEPDEDTKEFLTSMAQLLYMDKAAVMVLGMSTLLDAEYDRQLKTLSVSTASILMLLAPLNSSTVHAAMAHKAFGRPDAL